MKLIHRVAQSAVLIAGLTGLLLAAQPWSKATRSLSAPRLTASPTPVPTPEPTPVPTPAPTPVPPVVAAVGPAETQEAEQRLSDLGYWTGPIDGKLDGSSRHALIAFQKTNDRPRNGALTPDELQAIRTASRPVPRVHGYQHVEVDIRRQVLFFVETGGNVSRVLPISSGSGKKFTAQGYTRRAVTPRGEFKVQRKISGWRKSPLGVLHYPSYIVGGIAIHGAPSVPARPASHGCIRVPMFASQQVSQMLPVGTVVLVHDGGPIVQETDIASPPGQAGPGAAQPASPPPSHTPEPSPDRTPRPPRTPDPIPSLEPSPSPNS